MPSRTEMDRPAAVTAFALGVVLMLVSALLFAFTGGGGGGTGYTIGWSEAETGSVTAPVGGAGAPTTLRLQVNDVLPSNATVGVDCTDGGNPPLTGTATIAWTLYEGEEEKARGTFTCDGTNGERVAQEGRPDVGSATAGSLAEARTKAYAGLDNETVEYRAVFTWSRSGGTPLPVPAAFTGSYTLTVEHWVATATEPGAEGPR